jgi:beta-glucosidase/6-phospho-beta-glucosidase/beta-galactosidase
MSDIQSVNYSHHHSYNSKDIQTQRAFELILCATHTYCAIFALLFTDVYLKTAQKFGGWLGIEVQDAFAVYAEECYKAFGDRVKQWLTLNEPWSFVRTGYSIGVFPPGRCRYITHIYL